jgi:hypothetical protein
MSDLNQQNVHATNTCIVGNMIELGVEVMMRIDPSYVYVEQNQDAKEALADSIGAHILNSIFKEAGV